MIREGHEMIFFFLGKMNNDIHEVNYQNVWELFQTFLTRAVPTVIVKIKWCQRGSCKRALNCAERK